jgi:hypothetical protein
LVNPNGTGSVPQNQSINGNEDSAANAAVMSLASTPELELNWYCPVTQDLSSVDFTLSVLGMTVAHLTNQLSSNGGGSGPQNYVTCNAGATGKWSEWVNDFDSWSSVLSGVYSASIVVHGSSGSVVGSSTNFLIKVLPAYPPVTIFTIPLIAIVAFELYLIGRDYLKLNRLRPKNGTKASETSSSPTSSSPSQNPQSAASAPQSTSSSNEGSEEIKLSIGRSIAASGAVLGIAAGLLLWFLGFYGPVYFIPFTIIGAVVCGILFGLPGVMYERKVERERHWTDARVRAPAA